MIAYKDTQEVYGTYDSRSRADYIVIDVFGPEGNTVYVKEVN